MELISLIDCAVGKEVFAADSEAVMAQMLTTQQASSEPAALPWTSSQDRENCWHTLAATHLHWFRQADSAAWLSCGGEGQAWRGWHADNLQPVSLPGLVGVGRALCSWGSAFCLGTV